MDFLPKNYQIPSTSNYMKLEKGANKLRVMGSAIVGYEWWEEAADGSRKPLRSRTFQEAVKNGQEPIKHFWVFPVWNYKVERIQILELTQKSIQQVLNEYVSNDDWGSPLGYDITITRSGEGLETTYTVIASPHKEAPEAATKAMKETSINLNALFEGKDPFETKDLATDVAEALK